MRTDVSDLYEFYRSSLGRTAQRMLRRQVRAIWPVVTGMTVVGLGYAAPLLRPFRDEAERCIAAMPASQGVMRWPADDANCAVLAEEVELPFPDLSIDRMVLIHAVETAEELRPMMREVWRVLTGNGRIVVVVPNRRGLWARFDNNPFGSGRPYSASQLRRLMRDTLFTPLRSGAALYVPPSPRRMLLTGAEAWENIGVRWFPRFGGVVLVEATKQVYATPRASAAARQRVSYAAPPQVAL
ncbi:MAG: methyltransferase domain-containing protein, partial [Alphaproteobacteria bacterium]